MKRIAIVLLLVLVAGPAWQAVQEREQTLKVEGLQSAVRIIRDPWGVSHIYADNEADLFFAQGFNAARDRLFQLELWRRAATGTMAEALGEKALKRDVGARLLSYRGDMDEELRHYHPRGPQIIKSFVAGINAFVDRARTGAEPMPLEFRLLGISPQRWTPEVVVSRHNGLFRNAGDEVQFAKLVSKIGTAKLKELVDFQPQPTLGEAAELDLSSIPDEVLEIYRASRARFKFEPSDIVDSAWRSDETALGRGFGGRPLESARAAALDFWGVEAGSNNWVVAPSRSLTGKAFMANDPHRSLQVPSLRYFVHLASPEWNAIGGGEPALPGISIGHNQFGAWGLTIFSVDQEDLYVYRTNPENPSQYLYRGEWATMREIEERFQIEGAETAVRVLKFTRHGPVLFEDPERQRAYALRAAWLEVGSAPYLASLRFGQARSWEQFREACSYFRTPSENMVWADLDGNIGWQATGITPLRPNWSGLLPVPGDGRFEWERYLPILELPHVLNPPEGVFATANQNNLPPDFPHRVGYLWTPPFRFARILEYLESKRLLGLADMMALQTDLLSVAARALVPLLSGLTGEAPETRRAIDLLNSWDLRMDSDSSAAALYSLWERRLMEKVWRLHLPEEIREDFEEDTLLKVMTWLTAPDGRFGSDPVKGRDGLLLESLEEAISDLKERFGEDPKDWRYGHEKLHHSLIRHPLSPAVKPELRERLDVGPLPRAGNRETVNMTTSADNQRSGATFRVIVNLADWDRSLAANSPGQSGDPMDPHYRDLFPEWAQDRYFPLLFSRAKVEEVARSTLVLQPE